MRKWIPAFFVIVATVASIIAYPGMDERVPTHWNMSGEVDGWSSRFAVAWMLPLVMAGMVLLFKVLPLIDPRRANYEKFSGAYSAIVIVIMGFMLGMHLLLLAMGSGYDLPIERIVPASVGVMFIVLGLLLPKAHPNWFVGIRTPWTLSSDLSWERTHRLGGTLFMISGALAILSAFAFPHRSSWILVASGVGSVIFLFAYSFIVWKQDKNSTAVR
jgi:uncharacterized membrane protein